MSLTFALHPLPPRASAKPIALGSRPRAAELRAKIEAALDQGNDVVVDFGGVDATQSFLDELIGVLVLKEGVEALKQVTFKKCSPDVKAIIGFVVSDRARQRAAAHV
ncbi:STAS-like domain-containing protein [Acidovorax sp. NCPPB 3859]|nr:MULTISPECIES: STAS-like domain-containing protein [unclassified Acidovorax]MDA8450629.1 STAS-like domain-containing protein [Acidovorax sp. GBBC 3297]MDA8460004.1 STAS-like domain-containing protein [Acidovorax sp. GBBC 3333]MDA8465040.1 STAS-like domain-containing protein [Acidovorax sp. GBBC 3332]MDA8470144.1 STAS-like domain-containing protein [Acidovorax sp. GBBC 3299]WCM77155.1 STAS-like domain-containing protein [Acidovorax sp. GBBC 712]